NLNGQRFAVIRGEILIGEQRVRCAHDDEAFLSFSIPSRMDNGTSRAGFYHVPGKFVTVKILTAQSDEELAFFTCSRIGVDSFNRSVALALLQLGSGEVRNL